MYNNFITIHVPLLYQAVFFNSSMNPYDVHVHLCCELKCPIDPIPITSTFTCTCIAYSVFMHVHVHVHVPLSISRIVCSPL